MSKEQTPKGCFHYRMTHKGYNYAKSNFWQPGDPLTEEDMKMLRGVKDFYKKNGYSPSRADMKQDVGRLKHRFRVWKNVLIAAGLPINNDPENQRIKRNLKKGEESSQQFTIWKN